MKKRLLALFLALVMVVTSIPLAGFAANSSQTALAELKAQAEDALKGDNGVHTFIVQVKDPAAFQNSRRQSRRAQNSTSRNSLNRAIDARLASQDRVLDAILGTQGGDFQPRARMSTFFSASNAGRKTISTHNDRDDIRRYKAVINGFSLRMTYAEAKRVASLPNVERVSLSLDYKITPSMKHSRDIVHAQLANKKGYDGKGRVVAILDTGIDLIHPDLRLDDGAEKWVKYSEKDMNDAIRNNRLMGKFGNLKVPYIYNYADKNFDMATKDANHGQHIAGTIAGNGLKKDGPVDEQGVVGIVPNAQILAMRVFGAGEGLTGTDVYVSAIDDAVLLGADSINMSLGSYSGPAKGDAVMDDAVDNANAAGSIVVFAGGNDGFAMSGIGETGVDMLDYATLGSPGASKNVFTVASFNNSNIIQDPYKVVLGDKEFDAYPSEPYNRSDFEFGKEFDVVDCGLGIIDPKKNIDDFKDKDLNGKIALIQRGGADFASKIRNAADKGAIAVIMGNNSDKDAGRPFTMSLGEYTPTIPSVLIHLSEYKEVKDSINNGKKVAIKSIGKKYYDAPHAGKISDFSSWGPTPNLGLKPEITAPGGDIRSIDNTSKYEGKNYTYMSGTSMATPHVAGGILAVNAMLKEHPEIKFTKEEKSALIKAILMNTATLIEVPGADGKLFSVRLQGSGLMDLDRATNPNVVTVVDAKSDSSSFNEPKVELKQINETKLPINLNLRNYTGKEVSYDVTYVVQTDLLKEDGTLSQDTKTYKPHEIAKGSLDSVTVSANRTVNFAKTIDFSNGDLPTKFPKGYFVDAFVIFTPKNGDYPVLSVPVLAFKGNWEEDVAIFEDYIDTFKLDEKRPFWVEQEFTKLDNDKKVLDKEKLDNFIGDEINATMLVSNVGNKISRALQIDTIGRNIETREFTGNFAFSPNGDSIQDSVTFKGVFLRNYSDFKIEILDESDKIIKTISNVYRSDGRKTAGTVNMQGDYSKSISDGQWTWDGTNEAGVKVAEGNYKFKVSARINDNENAKPQSMVRDIKVDNTKPVATDLVSTYANGKTKISVKASDIGSGLQTVILISKGQDKDGKEVTYVDLLEANKNGEYSVEFDGQINLDGAYIRAFDWAGNTTDVNFVDVKNIGKVNIVKINEADATDIPTNEVEIYALDKDDKVTGKALDANNLPVGKYKAVMKNYPAGYEVTIYPEKFEITADAKEATVKVNFKKIEDTNKYGKLQVTLNFPADYNGNIRLVAVDEAGKEYALEKETSWGLFSYGSKLPAGVYNIKAIGEGSDPTVQVIGPTVVEIEPQGSHYITLQVVFVGSLAIPIYIVSKDKDAIEKFIDPADIEVVPFDGGEDIVIKNIDKYFTIIHKATGQELKDMNVNIADKINTAFRSFYNVDENSKLKEIDFLIPAPAGDYIVEVKNRDFEKYLILNDSIETKSVPWEKSNEKANFKGSEILVKDPSVNGTITVTQEIVGTDEKPANIVEVYDSKGRLIEPTGKLTWENLKEDDYTVVTYAKDGVVPETKSTVVSIYPDNEMEEVNFRYSDLNALPHPRKASLAIGVYGDAIPSDGEIKFVLTPIKEGKEAKTITLTAKDLKTPFQEVIEQGGYNVEVVLPEGYDLGTFHFSGEDFNDIIGKFTDNRTKVDLTLEGGFIEFEISLAKRDKIKNSVEIKSTGLPEDKMVKYTLANAAGEEFTSVTGIFRGLEAGEYKLTVEAPAGYKVVTAPEKINVADGKTTNIIVPFETSELAKTADNKVEKRDLKAEVNKEKDVKESDAYKYASKDLQKAYDQALNAAKAALEDDQVTQAEVYKKLNELLAAKGALNGVKPEEPEKKPDEPGTTEVPGTKQENPEKPIVPGPVPPIGGDWRYPQIPYINNFFGTTDTAKKETKPAAPEAKYGLEIAEPYLNPKFTDVPAELKSAVEYLATRGIMVGTSEDKFSPKSSMTRAMVVATLYRISADKNFTKVEKAFTDVKSSDWFYEAVLWAKEKGIVAGYEEGDFRPNKNVSRQEFAVIIMKFLKDHGINMPMVEEFKYSDEKEIPEWSKDAVELMKKVGLIGGKDDENYKPYGEYSRGELAETLYKLIQFATK
ncbi:MAG: S8 family serine peptidase [Peptoniphilus duerdenii]|uniref:S8 family serine peptidase n=1 Tax=Peptoniphilus duerdenii TaxID=507750 RepID=UPI00254DA1EB|nr:S8 family serine peptidase [Peptoniphilus duerdenii]MDK8275868.1 S8 family serine peptidase [Peptoniphilus duerdenii]